jgi:chromosome segregation ATPase
MLILIRNFIFILFLLLAGMSTPFAEDEPPMKAATDQFQYSLMILKQTIERVSADNARLTAKNDQLKQLLTSERMQLGQLQHRNEELGRASSKLRGTQPAHAKQLSALAQEIFEMQNRLDKQEAQLNVVRSALLQKEEEDRKLSEQLTQGQHPQAPAAPQTPDPQKDEVRKEKLKLMKMLYESKKHQGDLQNALVTSGKTLASAEYIQAQTRKRFLKEEISALQAQAPKEMPTPPPASPLDLRTQGEIEELEGHITSLQKNYDELEDLVEKMQKKAQAYSLQQDGKLEHDRLARGIEDLNRENDSLKSQLAGLRVQMVELDKRKTKLESMAP